MHWGRALWGRAGLASGLLLRGRCRALGREAADDPGGPGRNECHYIIQRRTRHNVTWCAAGIPGCACPKQGSSETDSGIGDSRPGPR